MCKKYLFVSLAFYIGIISSVQAQQKITLEEALSKALGNNLALQKQAVDANVAQIEAAKSIAAFLPRVNFNYTSSRTNDPLNVFGTKLKQMRVQQSDFNPTLLNNPDDVNNFNAAIKVEQPLFNLDGIYMRNAAKAKAIAAQYQLQRGKEYLSFQVKQLYAQLQLLYAASDVLAKVKETIIANVNLVNNLTEQGYAKPADQLAVKVRLIDVENKMLNNKINIENLSDHLYYLMGEKSQGTLEPSEKIKNTIPVPKLTANDNLQLNRADFLAHKEGIKAYRQMLRASRFKFMPRINAFGQYEMNDSKVFRGNAKSYMVGVQLSWNLFNGTQNIRDIQKTKAKLVGAQIDYQEYLARSQTEFSKAKRNIDNAIARISLAENALKQSEESFRIRKNRFEEGLEKTTDLLKDETQVEEKQLNYLQALFQLKTAIYYLEFLAVTNVEF